jgi:ligand-binding SRPBCC domain-containing protein
MLRVHVLTREQLVPVGADQAFAFFSDVFNLEQITPPWLRFRIATPRPIEMARGARIECRLTLHRVSLRWLTEIAEWEQGRRFVDVQLRGPFRMWEHTHTFEPAREGTLIRDRVRYALPYGPLGAVAHAAFVRRDLAAIFEYRRAAVEPRLRAG